MECLKSLDLIPAIEAGICPLCAMLSLNLSQALQHSAQNFGADFFFTPPLIISIKAQAPITQRSSYETGKYEPNQKIPLKGPSVVNWPFS